MAASSASSSSASHTQRVAIPCAVCLDPLGNTCAQQTLGCGHTFHTRCIHAMRVHGCVGRCPLCRMQDEVFTSFTGRSAFDEATRLLVQSYRGPGDRLPSLQRAAELFREFLSVTPDHVEALCNLGITSQLQGDIDTAVEQYRRALYVKPDHPDCLINLGDCLKKCGDMDGAISQYTAALSALLHHPRQVDVRMKLGCCLFQIGYVNDAIPQFWQVLEIQPRQVSALCYLGMAYKKQGDLEEAIRHYVQAKEIAPLDPDVHYCLGNALCEKGCIEEGLAEYSATLSIDPEHERAKNNIKVFGNAQVKGK